MKHPEKHESKQEQGQGMVEFAIALPVILIFLIGIIEAGWLMFFMNDVSMASREAARYAAVVGDSDHIKSGTTHYLHYEDCDGIRAAAYRIGAYAGISKPAQVEVYYPSISTANRYCDPTVSPEKRISSVALGDRIYVRVIGHYQPLAYILKLPTYNFAVVSTYSIMKNISVSQY